MLYLKLFYLIDACSYYIICMRLSYKIDIDT